MRKFILFAALAIIAIAAPAYAELEAFSESKLAHLIKYVGTHKHEEIMNDPYVRGKLDAMMGSQVAHLKENMNVAGPVDLTSGCLAMGGNAPHEGGSEESQLYVCLYNGDIHAAILSDGKIKVFSDASQYTYMPFGLRQWINHAAYNQQTPQPWKTPDIVEFEPTKKEN